MPKVSVILPIYNVRPYLRECLQSLQAQSLQDIEVILVDDGSTDGCAEICDEMENIDDRFHVIHKINDGVSAARNTGIEYAHAGYLMFVDPDDYVAKDFCKTAYSAVSETNSDLGIFTFLRFSDNQPPYSLGHTELNGKISHKDALSLLARDFVGNYPWDKIVARKLFANIRYPVHHLFEDVATTYKLVEAAEKITYINKPLYFYRDRPGSIVNDKSRVARKETPYDSFHYFNEFYSHLKARGVTLTLDDDYAHMLWPALSCCLYNADKRREKTFQEAFTFLRKTKIPKAMPIKIKIGMMLAKMSYPLFVAFCSVYGSLAHRGAKKHR